MATVTGTFASESDMQQAVTRILALGVDPAGIRIVNPPAETDAEPERPLGSQVLRQASNFVQPNHGAINHET